MDSKDSAKAKNEGAPWTVAQDIELMKLKATDASNVEVAYVMGRSAKAIGDRYRRLKARETA